MASKKPAAKKPVAKKPVAKKPAAKQPAAKQPAVKKPAAKKPAAKQPAARKPAAKQPAPAAKAAPRPPAPSVAPAPARSEPPPPPATPAVDHEAQLAALWQKLEAYVAARGGDLQLRPGASERDLLAAEKLMKVRFPPGFRASLRVHDGQASFGSKDARSFPWLPGVPPLAPLEHVVERWAALQTLAGKRKPSDELVAADRIKAGAHRTGRIPIAGHPRWTGDAVYLDLDPGKAGTPGQLIASVNDAWFVVDTSLEAALARWLFVLERGLWTYDAERHLSFPTGRDGLASNAAGLFSKR